MMCLTNQAQLNCIIGKAKTNLTLRQDDFPAQHIL